jgi:hypothetical protein
MDSCKYCKFWECTPPDVARVEAIQIGLCKRRAPLVEVNDKLKIPHWPGTRHTDWCGDFDSSIVLDEYDINW